VFPFVVSPKKTRTSDGGIVLRLSPFSLLEFILYLCSNVPIEEPVGAMTNLVKKEKYFAKD
jgi:hypothetical protein